MAKNKVKEFTSTPIKLMGEEYYFKRCPTETLKVYDEKIQKKLESSEEVRKQGEKLESELEMNESRIKNLNRKVELIDKKEEPSDKELDESMEILDKIDSLYDEQKEIKQSIDEYNKEYRDYFEKFTDEVNELIAEKGEALLDGFNKEQFLANYDIVDMRIMTNISKYYEMCMLGERASKVQEAIRKDAERISGREEEFQRR